MEGKSAPAIWCIGSLLYESRFAIINQDVGMTASGSEKGDDDVENNAGGKDLRKTGERHSSNPGQGNKVAADFQCFVCGAVFTTDQDRKQHLEKEAHGVLHEDSTEEDTETAERQEELNESHAHRI